MRSHKKSPQALCVPDRARPMIPEEKTLRYPLDLVTSESVLPLLYSLHPPPEPIDRAKIIHRLTERWCRDGTSTEPEQTVPLPHRSSPTRKRRASATTAPQTDSPLLEQPTTREDESLDRLPKKRPLLIRNCFWPRSPMRYI